MNVVVKTFIYLVLRLHLLNDFFRYINILTFWKEINVKSSAGSRLSTLPWWNHL